MDLSKKWLNSKREKQFTFATSVRLRPDIDCDIQLLLSEFPQLTQTQILNDLLRSSLDRTLSQIPFKQKSKVIRFKPAT